MVLKYVILILRKDKYILGCFGLYFWGEAELILGIERAKANTFRETRTLFAGRWGDQCIIFRDQGSTDPPPWGPLLLTRSQVFVVMSKTVLWMLKKAIPSFLRTK